MNVQKQPPGAFCKKMCSWKFHKIHRKTPVPEAFFNKVAVVFIIKFELISHAVPVFPLLSLNKCFVRSYHPQCYSATPKLILLCYP